MVIAKVINNTGVIKLNRPAKRNALNPELTEALRESLASYKDDDNVRSIIITGEGKAFCAGADLEYLLSLKDSSIIDNREDSQNIASLFLDLYSYPKPLIAAVNGAAIAGGCGLASVCDFVAAHSQHAKFGYSEVKIGFIPAIVSIFLIRRIGEVKAKQLLISADIIEAETALKIGLADYLSDDPLNTAFEIASKLNQNSLSSIIMTKKMINTISTLPVNEAVEYCIELNAISRSSEDFINGLDSFFKKQD
jgi:methylglutaconyl-CoA hydratase